MFLFFALAPCRRPRPEQKKTPWVVFFFLLWPRAGAQRSFSFPCLLPRGRSKKKNTLGGVFFFALAPCRRPRPEQKTKHPGWCFCFALAPCRRPTGLLLPLPFPGAGAKKKTPWVVFFFLLWPRRGAQRTSPSPAFPRGRSKKKTPWVVFFFLLWPRAGAQGRSKKKTPWVVFFFLLWPRAGAQQGFSFPCLSPGPEQKKKTPWLVFFFFALAPPRRPTERNKKKNTLHTRADSKKFSRNP